MALSFTLPALAAGAILGSLVGCSGDTSAPASKYQTGPTSGGETSSSSSSSGGSSSGGSSSGGSSLGSTTANCSTAPSFGSKKLADLAPSEKGQLCDYVACSYGGYGQSKSCADGSDASADASQSDCLLDFWWTDCPALPASDFLACNKAVSADVCNLYPIVQSDPACASYKVCGGFQ
jgi:hypothetical protein